MPCKYCKRIPYTAQKRSPVMKLYWLECDCGTRAPNAFVEKTAVTIWNNLLGREIE